MQSPADRRTHPAVQTMLAQRLIAVIRTSSPALAITAGRAPRWEILGRYSPRARRLLATLKAAGS